MADQRLGPPPHENAQSWGDIPLMTGEQLAQIWFTTPADSLMSNVRLSMFYLVMQPTMVHRVFRPMGTHRPLALTGAKSSR